MLVPLALAALAGAAQEAERPDPAAVEEALHELRVRTNGYETVEAHYRFAREPGFGQAAGGFSFWYRAPDDLRVDVVEPDQVTTFWFAGQRTFIRKRGREKGDVVQDAGPAVVAMHDLDRMLDDELPESRLPSDERRPSGSLKVFMRSNGSDAEGRTRLTVGGGYSFSQPLLGWLGTLRPDWDVERDGDHLVFHEPLGIDWVLSTRTGLIEHAKDAGGGPVLERWATDEELDPALFEVGHPEGGFTRDVEGERAMMLEMARTMRSACWMRLAGAELAQEDLRERTDAVFAHLQSFLMGLTKEDWLALYENELARLAASTRERRERAGDDPKRRARFESFAAARRKHVQALLDRSLEQFLGKMETPPGLDPELEAVLVESERAAAREAFDRVIADAVLARYDELVAAAPAEAPGVGSEQR